MKSEIRQAIEQADWERVCLSLAIYTRRKLKGKFWRGVVDGPIPGGKEIEDFVQETIASFLEHPDAWDPQNKSLLEHLMGMISSRISHAAYRLENTSELRSTTDPHEANQFTVDTSNIEGSHTSHADAVLKFSDERRVLLEMCEEHRPEDRDIVRVIIDEDLYTPREIALRLNISVTEVNNARKRLRRNPQYQRLLALKRALRSFNATPTERTSEPETIRKRA